MFALAHELKMTVEQVQEMRLDEYYGWLWYFKERSESMKRGKHG